MPKYYKYSNFIFVFFFNIHIHKFNAYAFYNDFRSGYDPLQKKIESGPISSEKSDPLPTLQENRIRIPTL